VATYIALMNWTDRGVEAGKNTVERSRETIRIVESLGGNVQATYWTLGAYDVVLVIDAPDDEALAAMLMTLGASGNLRSQTLRAFTADDMTRILDTMS
jgi:uncharacterized protein with GYD domain